VLRGQGPILAFCLGLIVLTGVFGLAYRNTARQGVDAWRQHTYVVIAESRALLSALLDAQTGQRGFLLTGDESILTAYDHARAEVSELIASLRRLTADNPRQQRRLDILAPEAAAFLVALDQGIADRRSHQSQPQSTAADLADRGMMNRLRRRLTAMESEETQLLTVRDAAMLTALRHAELALCAGLAASAALLVAAALALRREAGQRRRAEEATHHLNTRLAASNHELEAFCYAVSHDLRAPLRAVDGFSQALIEDAAERLLPADRQLLDRVRAAAQRMAALIDDLLRLSRISQTTIQPKEVDLSELAGTIVSELRRRDPQRRAVVDIEAGMHAVGDESLLRVALENLLGNAWKFTRHREEAHIRFGSEEQPDQNAVYLLHDDGAGFDMTYSHKLFGAFQRLHSEREFEGSGIGLATVARVIHLHGGRIWAEAKVGQGASFYFTLAAPATLPRKD
jgi:signal transduction histidine kinase